MPAVSKACAINLVRATLYGTLALAGTTSAALAEPTHAIAMHGKPAMADGFYALPYANPDAPKGCLLYTSPGPALATIAALHDCAAQAVIWALS